MNSVVRRVAGPRGPRVATSLSPARRSTLRVATRPLVHPRSGSGAATRPFGRWVAGGRSAARRATRHAARPAPSAAAPRAPSAAAPRAPPAAAPRAAPAAAPRAARMAAPRAAQRAAIRAAAPPHRRPPIVRPAVGPVIRQSRAPPVGRGVRLACATGGRTRVRLPAWPHHHVARLPELRMRMAALWQCSLRAERGRGRDSAIPRGPHQLTRSRAINVSVSTLDEYALGNVTGQARPAAAIPLAVDGRGLVQL